MYIARILYPVKVLGPGNRIGIWFCGCPHHCIGCSNPELWDFDNRYKTTEQTLLKLIHNIADKYPVDGFTITGGEPFYQRETLLSLIKQIKSINPDILVYTGYNISELITEDLKDIAVLIDGKYIERLNNNCCLRGSENQIIHILNDEYTPKYYNYINTEENKIQNFTLQDSIISVGIHRPQFKF